MVPVEHGNADGGRGVHQRPGDCRCLAYGLTITRQSNRRLGQETEQAEHRLKQEHSDEERR